MDDVKDAGGREPYEAPTVEDVPVRAEEQMLAGCKTPTGGGPGAFFCAQTSCSSGFGS